MDHEAFEQVWHGNTEDDSLRSLCGAPGVGSGLTDMLDPSSRPGNVLNVYTEPDFLQRGLARWLIDAEPHWSKVKGIDSVILHAYESVGFETGNQISIQL